MGQGGVRMEVGRMKSSNVATSHPTVAELRGITIEINQTNRQDYILAL